MMRRLAGAVVVGALVAGVWPLAPVPAAQAPPAELVLVNGKVITVNAGDAIAEAVAVTGGRIVAVGTNADIRALAGAATEVIDLGGRSVTPGLIDTHVHFTEVDALFSIDLSDLSIKSMKDVQARVAAQVAKVKPGEWVLGDGWDEGKLAERRHITAADLDEVAPNNPVWLGNTTGHYGVGNAYALKIAEIRKGTPDPPAGTIVHKDDGEPNGVVLESAQQLITRHIPPFTREQQKAGLVKMIQDFNAEGMIAAKDPGIGPLKWELYKELLAEGRLTVRLFALWAGPRALDEAAEVQARVDANPRPPASLGDGMLFSGGVKMYMDGSGGARTAWMHEDWNKNLNDVDTGNSGYPATPPDHYRTMATNFHNAGVHVSTHAIGDRAIDWVVDTYAQAIAAKPTRGLRHGIIHANIPSDHANDEMARLQRDYDAAFPEASASFLWWIGDTYAGNFGPRRNLRMKPLKTWAAKGIRWGGGSDFSVTPFAARYGLWASVARQTLNGTFGKTPFGMDEAVDVGTALKSYTIWAAHTIFLDDRIGSIEVGKDADLAVWDRDPYTVPTAALRDMKAELTMVKGKAVFRGPAFPEAARGR
ncbi:MAG: amidohydrolase [Acidobacteria bacterium]|nr:amidohydrolase [Acidobacteriota bacterium]